MLSTSYFVMPIKQHRDSTCKYHFICAIQRISTHRTPKAKCLNNVPPKRKRHKAVFYSNPGSVIDANLQCEMFGGEGAKACYFGDDAEVSSAI